MRFTIFVCLLFIIIHRAVYPQNFIEAGITAGPGFISSDSPYLSGFTTSVYAGAGKIFEDISARFSFYYAGDINSLLPASSKSYYPFIKAFSLEGIYSINVTDNYFYEQGLGLFTANDRIFRNTNSWGTGFIISVLGGADLRGLSYSGFRIGIGGEYGLTFLNRHVRYFGLYFQVQYIIQYN